MKNLFLFCAFFLQMGCFGQCVIDSSSISKFVIAFNHQYEVRDKGKTLGTRWCYVDNSVTYILDDLDLPEKTQDIIFYDVVYRGNAKAKNIEKLLISSNLDSITAKKLTKYMLCKYESTCLKEINEWEVRKAKYYADNNDPEFPGRIRELMKFIQKNLKYPYPALISKMEGKVYVQFVVDPKGNILNPEVVKGIGYGCDEEAMRIIRAMPQWTGGKQNGKPISVRKSVPISFRIPQ